MQMQQCIVILEVGIGTPIASFPNRVAIFAIYVTCVASIDAPIEHVAEANRNNGRTPRYHHQRPSTSFVVAETMTTVNVSRLGSPDAAQLVSFHVIYLDIFPHLTLFSHSNKFFHGFIFHEKT